MSSNLPTYHAETWETRINHYRYWFLDLLLILILATGGYFRFVGTSWDEDQHLHPDERFLTMVENNMTPVESLGDYFNTDLSTLNPHNVGHSFYVYGDFPIIFTRYIAEWTNQTTYDTVNVLGRQISASFDLLTILMVFLIGKKLYDRRIGLLSSAFYSLAVIPIQLSHFFAVDTFAGFFVSVAIYAAVSLYRRYQDQERISAEQGDAMPDTWSGIGYYLLFGAALALAMASKVSTAPLAVILPLAVFCWYIRLPVQKQVRWFLPLLRNMLIAAAFAFLLFRIFQPYAFAGPSFFNIRPNPKFVQNLTDLKGQTSGQADFPPALQWARQSKLFAFKNLTIWGTGLPLGILGWIAFLWMAIRMIRGEWSNHLTIWLWTGAYFAWQSISWNPMMRYTYLIYPTFCIMAGWLIIRIWDTRFKKKIQTTLPEAISEDDTQQRSINVDTGQQAEILLVTQVYKQSGWAKLAAILLALIVLAGSAGWAYAFTRIYTRPVTRIAATRWIYQNVPGPVNLQYETIDGQYNQPIFYPYGAFIVNDQPLSYDFNAAQTGRVTSINFYRIGDMGMVNGEKQLTFTITDAATNTRMYTDSISSDFIDAADPRGSEYTIQLETPILLVAEHRYNIRFELVKGEGLLTIVGSAPANESDWDDGLPLRMDKYDGFGGIYDGTLNFQMYWEDDEEKRERFITTLDRADYIFISSNRQWGTTTRVPERYPLTTTYYRNLVGCPALLDTLVCLAQAEPGKFTGNLGFDLVQVFESYPNLGSIKINDQLSEESFTVYDHPKVFIFKKNSSYDPQFVANLFNEVDLSRVIHTPPGDVPSHPQDLMLPADRLAGQQSGGSWSELFQRDVFYNARPWAAAAIWYLVLLILGICMIPLLLLVFRGFKDRGYGFGRITALLLVALFTWWAGSYGVAVNRFLISIVIMIILSANLVFALLQRDQLKQYLRENWKHLLITEGVILAFFLIDLGIRIGNPDLWHISKGGEKPMDFAYLNAVLKSTTFPPYDPWFAGGYINYYYYGFVIVGVLIKWLGIIPSIAYNLVVPTLFALLAIGAYTILYNLVHHTRAEKGDYTEGTSPYWFAILAAAALTIFGNLGTLRMIWYGLQMLAAPGGDISAIGTTFFNRMLWSVQGLVKFFQGGNLPYGMGEWYWNPSRVIPAINDVEPITEFPMFTFIYSDLHAHMIALPITLFALGWAIQMVLSKGYFGSERKLGQLSLVTSIFVCSVGVGALRPTNTWDFPVFAILAGLAISYAGFRNLNAFAVGLLAKFNNRWLRWLVVIGLFGLLTIGLYQPFDAWYGAGYTAIESWEGSHTPPWSYLTHWGIFLFFIIFWFIQETIDWMASTPLRKLAVLKSYTQVMIALGLLVVAAMIGLVFLGAWIAWFVVPIALWATILLFRPGQSDTKRIVLFLIGTGLFLTLFVEIFVLKGDIGRMNTVFKFYLQVWSLFTVSACAAIYWSFCDSVYWRSSRSRLFQTLGWLLLLCVMLFPFTATASKIRDRYVPTASHSLDGMGYMLGATYLEHDVDTGTSRVMELEQDYHAIRWMQDNIQGSPVIVEGSVTEYKWGSRYSIYTGLPDVVGWNWHQRQQRGVANPVWVQDRVNQVNEFYSTPNVEEAVAFLKKYNVKYIVVGQMEDIIYPLTGTAKFSAYENIYWKPVYSYKATTIYEVIGS